MTVPGIGPLIATAIAVLAPPHETLSKACDFAARLGLVPQKHSTGGKQRRSLARHMAWRDADAQATNAGAGGAGEQDGADRLGAHGPGRRPPVSGRGGVSFPSVAKTSEGKRAGRSLAEQS